MISYKSPIIGERDKGGGVRGGEGGRVAYWEFFFFTCVPGNGVDKSDI